MPKPHVQNHMHNVVNIAEEIVFNFKNGMKFTYGKKWIQYYKTDGLDEDDYFYAFLHGVLLLLSIVVSTIFCYKLKSISTAIAVVQLVILYMLGMESVRKIIKRMKTFTEMFCIVCYTFVLTLIHSFFIDNSNNKVILLLSLIVISLAENRARQYNKHISQSDDWIAYSAFYLPLLMFCFASRHMYICLGCVLLCSNIAIFVLILKKVVTNKSKVSAVKNAKNTTTKEKKMLTMNIEKRQLFKKEKKMLTMNTEQRKIEPGTTLNEEKYISTLMTPPTYNDFIPNIKNVERVKQNN